MDSHTAVAGCEERRFDSPWHWKRRVSCVVTITCCWLIHCTLGFSYTFGNITPYLTSYLRNSTGNDDLDYTDTLWIASINSVSACALMPVVGVLSTCLPTHVYLLIGTLCTAATQFGTYKAVQMSLLLTVLTYGLLGGIPAAILYPAPLNIAARWLPERVGLVSGLILTGYGCGAVAWNQLTTWYINSHNLQPDVKHGADVYYSQPAVLERVPHCFLLLGTVFTSIQLLSVVMIREASPPEPKTTSINADTSETSKLISPEAEDDVVQYGSTNSCQNCSQDAEDCRSRDLDQPESQYRPTQLLKSRAFWTLWFLVFFSDLSCNFVTNLFKAYGQTFIPDDHFLTLAASFSSVCNAIARPFWGWLADKLGPRSVALYTQCMLACLIATFVTCEVTGRVAYFVWVCGMYFTMCGYFSTIPLFIMGLFGTRYFNTNLGLIFTADIFCSLLSALVASNLKDIFGWHGIFFFSFGCIFVGILLNLTLDIRRGSTIPKHMFNVLSIRD